MIDGDEVMDEDEVANYEIFASYLNIKTFTVVGCSCRFKKITIKIENFKGFSKNAGEIILTNFIFSDHFHQVVYPARVKLHSLQKNLCMVQVIFNVAGLK